VFWLVEVFAGVDLRCLLFDDALSFLVTVLSWVLLHKKTNNQPIVDVMFINAQ
jgi:hypothetical protein